MNSEMKLSLEFMDTHPLDAARVLERLLPEKAAALMKETPSPQAAKVLERMDLVPAVDCLKILGVKKSGAILEKLSFELASLFLRKMEKTFRESVLGDMTPEFAHPIRRVLQYPEGTAGALMNPLVFTVPEDIPAREALKRARKHPQQIIDYLYVLNRENGLAGLITIRELMLANPDAPISAMTPTQVGRLSAHSNRQAILAHPGWRELYALPVVDENGLFLGAIGYHTLRRLEGEADEIRVVDPGKTAGSALGELYRIGLAGLLKSAISAVEIED